MVVVNATGVPSVATLVAADLRLLGYVDVVAIDAEVGRDASVVVYLPGFENEARWLAMQRGVADVAPRATEPLPLTDSAADIWLIVGSDAL